MFKYNKINSLIINYQIKNKGVVLADIAKLIGMSNTSLSNYKEGKAQPTVEKLEKIALFFEVDMNYFFDSKETLNYSVKTDESQIIKEPIANYDTSKPTVDRLLTKVFEQQEEILELRLGMERLKNEYAQGRSANAG
jgi:transcriptional regulator with XRE-family HTH domain